MSVLPSLFHYLPVNDSAWRWGIYLTGVGHTVVAPGQSYPPQRHPTLYDFTWAKGRTLPEFAVILISAGRGIFESQATGRLEVRTGHLLFLFPGIWHRYQPAKDTGWTERWITINGPLVHRLVEHGMFTPESAVRQSRTPGAAEQAMDALLARVHDDPGQNLILLSLHTMGCLAQLIETARGEELPGALDTSRGMEEVSDPLVAEATRLIWTRSHHALTVPRVARALGVNRRTLERRFQLALGHSVLAEIALCRLNRAKELLAETSLPIKTVAYLAGFHSQERMRLGFLAHEGISPSEFRQKGWRRR